MPDSKRPGALRPPDVQTCGGKRGFSKHCCHGRGCAWNERLPPQEQLLSKGAEGGLTKCMRSPRFRRTYKTTVCQYEYYCGFCLTTSAQRLGHTPTQGCQARLTEPVGCQCKRPDPARATTGASAAVDHSRSRPGRVKPISLVHRAPGLLTSVLLSRSSSRARAAIVRMARTRAKGTRHVECPANGTIRGRRGG